MGPRHASVALALLVGVFCCAAPALGQASPTPDAPAADAPSNGGAEVRPSVPPPLRAPEIEIGRDVDIVLSDGRHVTGELLEESPVRYLVRVGEVPTSFDKSTIRGVRALPTVEEQYALLREAIADEDVDGRLRLAEWCRLKGRIDLALWEVDQSLEVQPANPQAREMRTLLIEQEKLNRAPAKGAIDEDLAAQARKERQADSARAAFPLLSPEQINLIRVYETDLRNPPRLSIPREAVLTFLDTYKGKSITGRGAVPVTPEARDLFLHQKAPDTLGWFFDARARELYPKVQVLENPASFKLFRDNVNRTWLTNSCATNRCHGGEEAGRLWLYNLRTGIDASFYTNFLILDRFRTSTGQPLINYEKPGDSILLQMALPRDQAVIKHPELAGPGKGRWRPAFTNTRDPRYVKVVEWIRSMYPQRPEYPIEYHPPTPQATSSPNGAPR